VSRFDGVALLQVATPDARSQASGVRALASALERGLVLRLRDGSSVQAERPPGFPRRLTAPDGDELVLTGLVPSGQRASAGHAIDALQGRTEAGPWSIARVAVLPPVPSGDLLAVQPLDGGRIHIGLRQRGVTACRRLPLRGDQRPVGLIDCGRCLRAQLITDRQDRQLLAYPELVAMAGPLLAGAAAQLWRWREHRDPSQVPGIIDAAVGAVVHGFPGAATVDEALALVSTHRAEASVPARSWAAGIARDRLDDGLRAQRRRRQHGLGPQLHPPLRLLAALMTPAEAAELLVGLLEQHGPSPYVEHLALDAARRAGDAASERVRRWRRLHEIAAALSGTHADATTA